MHWRTARWLARAVAEAETADAGQRRQRCAAQRRGRGALRLQSRRPTPPALEVVCSSALQLAVSVPARRLVGSAECA